MDVILPLGMADTKRFLHQGLFLSDFSSSLSFRSSICKKGRVYIWALIISSAKAKLLLHIRFCYTDCKNRTTAGHKSHSRWSWKCSSWRGQPINAKPKTWRNLDFTSFFRENYFSGCCSISNLATSANLYFWSPTKSSKAHSVCWREARFI